MMELFAKIFNPIVPNAHLSTPEKSENRKVFRGQRKDALRKNGLMIRTFFENFFTMDVRQGSKYFFCYC